MKSLKWLVPFLLVLAAIGWSAVALAQNPVTNDPGTATYIDNQTHSIPGNGAQWYRFNYGGGNSLITVTLVNGAGGSLGFNVFTPTQIADWTNETPIGRGTVLAINCNSGLPSPGGGCQGNDLVWGGKFRDGGTYYVQVVNSSPQSQSFLLTVAGDDVAQCVPAGQTGANPAAPVCEPVAAVAPTVATEAGGQASAPTATMTVTQTVTVPTTAAQVISATVTATSTATGIASVNPLDVNAPNTFYTDPYHAIPLDGQMRTLPGNASIWYRFEYSGDGSPIELRMENGALNGLAFSLYLPEQAPDWGNEAPIGRGTATQCAETAEDASACGENVNALLWSGKFQSGGTYFVRVTNPTPNPVPFALTVSGTGVSICSPAQAQAPMQPGSDFFPCPGVQEAGATVTPGADAGVTPAGGPSLTPRPTGTATPAG